MELMFPKLHEQECLEPHFNELTLEKLSRWKENTQRLDKIAVNMGDQTSRLCLCSLKHVKPDISHKTQAVISILSSLFSPLVG